MTISPTPGSSYLAILQHGHYEQPIGVPNALLPHPLTAKGQRQAEGAVVTLKAMLKDHKLKLHSIIDTSPTLRSWETAKIIAGQLYDDSGNGHLCEIDNLTERSLGAMANLTVDQIEEAMNRDPRYQAPAEGWKRNSWYRLPFTGAESLMESGIRVASHLQEVAAEIKGTGLLKILVGHGASFRHAALCLGILKPSEVPALCMHHGSPILLEKSENGKWSRIKGDWKLRLPLAEEID